MNIAYLEEFIELGTNLNFNKTAKRLHISQSALSKHIASLEKECGTPILDRSTSHVKLTKAGQVLLEQACDLVAMHDRVLGTVRSYRDAACFNVGGLYSNATIVKILDEALSSLNASSSCYSVAYQDYRFQTYSELLKDGRLDVEFTILDSSDELDPELERTFLFYEPMVCLVRETHPFANRASVSVDELANQVILRPVGTYSAEHGRSTVASIFERHKIKPVEKSVFVRSISEFYTVSNTDCILIMEHSMPKSQPLEDSYRVLRIEEPDARFGFFAVHKADPDKEGLEAFIVELQRQAAAMFPDQRG